MDINTVRGLITLFLFIGFMGIVAWCYSKKRRPDFDKAAQMPFDDEAQHDQTIQSSEEKKQ